MDIITLIFWRFCLLSIILFCSYNFGVFALTHLFSTVNGRKSFQSVILSVSLGLAGLSFTILFIGLSGILNESVIWCILIICFFLNLNSLGLIVKYDYIMLFQRFFKKVKNLDNYNKYLLFLLFLLIIMNLLGSLSAPMGVDDVKYHFAIPKRYLNNEIINFMPDIGFSNFPFPIEMLWTIAIALDSGELAQLLNFSLGIIVLCWLYIISKKASLDLQSIILSFCLFYSISNVGYQARSGSVEMGGVLFFLAGFYCLNEYMERNKYGILVLSGLFFGVFSVVKLSNPAVVILMTPWLIINFKNSNKSITLSLQSAFLFSFSAFIIASIWYCKSYMFTGNPFYPFLRSIFGGPSIDVNLLSWGNSIPLDADSSLSMSHLPSRYFTQFWYFLTNTPKLRGHISPLYICMLPIVYSTFKSQKKIIKDIIIITILFYIYWIAFYPFIRIGLPLFAIFSIPIALAIRRSYFNNRIRKLLYILLIVFCSISLFNSIRIVYSKLPLLYGFKKNISYITNLDDSYQSESALAIDFINNNLDQNAKILMWSNSGFYLERDYLYVKGFITTMADPDKIYDPEHIIDELKRFGITHLAMTDNYLRRKLKNLLLSSEHINIIYNDKNMIVAALK